MLFASFPVFAGTLTISCEGSLTRNDGKPLAAVEIEGYEFRITMNGETIQEGSSLSCDYIARDLDYGTYLVEIRAFEDDGTKGSWGEGTGIIPKSPANAPTNITVISVTLGSP